MLTSFALVLLSGLFGGWLFGKLGLPRLLGMLLAGMVLGPWGLNLLSDGLMAISADLRQLALIVILTRAGLGLDLSDLKKVGRPAFFMCFLPACFEILGMVILAPLFFDVSIPEAALMGAVVGAVSPAVIVPGMLRLMESGHGVKKGIPQLIMAGASVDDVFVIVLFSAFTSLVQGEAVSAATLLTIPVSIVLGLGIGLGLGKGLSVFFEAYPIRPVAKTLILLGVSCVLIYLGNLLPFSALLSVMAMGICIKKTAPNTAKELSAAYSALWSGAELWLFVLVGAAVSLPYALSAGGSAILLVLLALIFRTLGVILSTAGSSLTSKERLFCAIAYLPKATVQAAIGGVPLSLGLGCGELVLTVAVVAILVTAPLGAYGIEKTHHRLLQKNPA